ncbi:hypothetical protein ACLOJK_007916 [Asimina triloba]
MVIQNLNPRPVAKVHWQILISFSLPISPSPSFYFSPNLSLAILSPNQCYFSPVALICSIVCRQLHISFSIPISPSPSLFLPIDLSHCLTYVVVTQSLSLPLYFSQSLSV